MTIRNRLTLRFTTLVSAILALTFMCIYAFCWYFITSDFFRRLNYKSGTIAEMLIRHRLDADLVRDLNRIRKDQLPDQNITVYDSRDSVIFESREGTRLAFSAGLLDEVRQRERKDFRQQGYYVSGLRFLTPGQTGNRKPYVVIASASNLYGDRFLSRLILALVSLYGIIVGITILAGRLFASDALRPMQRMDDQLNAIFPRNRQQRLPVQSHDEISRLSATINRLLDRVEETFRLQKMFVANVSHELKNPLTQISSQLEVSLLNERPPEKYRQTIRSVLADVTDLSTLTHELLQLSQVSQEGAAALLTDAVRIDELLWDLRQEVTSQHAHYRVQIHLGDLPDDPAHLTIPGNRTLLASAFRNLIENACKFAHDGQARVELTILPENRRVTIQNQGRTIEADEIPYLFEPFYRSRRTADAVQGYGIGLSLVKHIIQLHRGEISVFSEEGKPTEFRVDLPGLNFKPF